MGKYWSWGLLLLRSLLLNMRLLLQNLLLKRELLSGIQRPLLDRLGHTPDLLLFSSLLHIRQVLDGLLLDRVRHAPDRAAQA